MKVQFCLNIPVDVLDFCREHAEKNDITPTRVMCDAIIIFKNKVEKKHGT